MLRLIRIIVALAVCVLALFTTGCTASSVETPKTASKRSSGKYKTAKYASLVVQNAIVSVLEPDSPELVLSELCKNVSDPSTVQLGKSRKIWHCLLKSSDISSDVYYTYKSMIKFLDQKKLFLSIEQTVMSLCPLRISGNFKSIQIQIIQLMLQLSLQKSLSEMP